MVPRDHTLINFISNLGSVAYADFGWFSLIQSRQNLEVIPYLHFGIDGVLQYHSCHFEHLLLHTIE